MPHSIVLCCILKQKRLVSNTLLSIKLLELTSKPKISVQYLLYENWLQRNAIVDIFLATYIDLRFPLDFVGTKTNKFGISMNATAVILTAAVKEYSSNKANSTAVLLRCNAKPFMRPISTKNK